MGLLSLVTTNQMRQQLKPADETPDRSSVNMFDWFGSFGMIHEFAPNSVIKSCGDRARNSQIPFSSYSLATLRPVCVTYGNELNCREKHSPYVFGEQSWYRLLFFLSFSVFLVVFLNWTFLFLAICIYRTEFLLNSIQRLHIISCQWNLNMPIIIFSSEKCSISVCDAISRNLSVRYFIFKIIHNMHGAAAGWLFAAANQAFY